MIEYLCCPRLGVAQVNVYAGVAELADALDLGSSGITVGVQVPSPAPKRKSCRLLSMGFSFCIIHFSLFNIHHSLQRIFVMNNEVAYADE